MPNATGAKAETELAVRTSAAMTFMIVSVPFVRLGLVVIRSQSKLMALMVLRLKKQRCLETETASPYRS